MSVSEDEVRQLAARVEDQKLDFKETFYGPNDNAEMAKDIMAIANNLGRDEVGYIRIFCSRNGGFRSGRRVSNERRGAGSR